MNEPNPTPGEDGPRPTPPDAWKDVVMGQVSHPLVALVVVLIAVAALAVVFGFAR